MHVVEHLLRLRPGGRLIHAALGGLGVEFARAHHPDLVLLDLHLPDLAGREVLRALKRRDDTKDIPVVILSADASPGLARPAGRRGCRAASSPSRSTSTWCSPCSTTWPEGGSGPGPGPTRRFAMTEQPVDGPARAEGASLLVVEDFEPMSVLLVRVLSAEGYRVTPAATAHAVRAACAAEDFDLIVTDVHIPGGNGAEIVRDVAAERPGCGCCSSRGTPERDLDLHVPGGHTDFLQKPFDIDELAERVRRLLDADAGPA